MASKIAAVAALACALVLASPQESRADAMGNWAGPYAGVYAGYAFGDSTAGAATDPSQFFPFYNGADTPYRLRADGAAAGVTVGYNWQWGRTVAGVEAEVGYLGLTGSAIDPNGIVMFGTADTTTAIETDFHAALLGRVGAVVGNALIYAKAGGTLLNARASNIDPCANVPGCGTSTLTMYGDKVMLGWTVGGGVEWAINPRWTAKVDYSYSDFGSIQTAGTSSIPGEFYRQHIDVTAHALKLGVNYRFGGPAR